MGVLLRTTSRFECQNNFFSNFITPSSFLVGFLLQFDNAIDSQRHTQRKADYESSTGYLSMKIPLKLKQFCAETFTLNIFYDLQQDIYEASFHIELYDYHKDVVANTNYIHVKSTYAPDKVFIVKHVLDKDEIICSCNKLINVDRPCAHILFMLRTIQKDVLPECYVLPCWTKKANLKPLFEVDDTVLRESVEVDEKKALLSELVSCFHYLVNDIEDDLEAIQGVLDILRKERNERRQRTSTMSGQGDFIGTLERFVGPIPSTLYVIPPPKSKNKGRPRRSRIQGIVEKIYDKAKNETRYCKQCNKPGHSSRTFKEIKDNNEC